MSIRIETLSTFPEMFSSVMNTSMMRLAQGKGLLEFQAHDLRDWTHDKHRTTDDEPYGGGQGLVMKCEPIFEAWEAITDETKCSEQCFTVFVTPAGERFTDQAACELAAQKRLLFVCGHYEGIDERAYTLANRCLSIGDYVLTSGELASMVIIDAVVRKIPGVLGNNASASDESFIDGLLEYPQYTRPAEYRGMEVPPVLLSGNHAAVDTWRRQQSIARTAKVRPDLLESAELSDAEHDFLKTLLPGNTHEA